MVKKLLYGVVVFITACSTYSTWMRDNSRYIDTKTIAEITIPGSHLANSYSVTLGMPLCMGEVIESTDMSVNGKLWYNSVLTNRFNQESFINYLNTQDTNIRQQLNSGIRYLELQVCQQNFNTYTSNVYLTALLDDITKQIKDFIDTHSEEIVIIDVDNNLWADYGRMKRDDIDKLYQYLVNTFANSLAPKTMRTSAISEFKNSGKQIILLSSNMYLASYPFVWDKREAAITGNAEYSTIKKLQLMQNALQVANNARIISIVPFYSALPYDNYSNSITTTNEDDDIVLNYLIETLDKHALIVVTDRRSGGQITKISILNNKNVDTTH